MMNLQKLVVILFGLIFSSCSTPNPPNVEACIRLEFGAACGWTIDGPERDMSEADFLSSQLGIIFFPDPKSYEKIRLFIEQTCAIYKDCEKKVIERMDYFSERFNLENP